MYGIVQKGLEELVRSEHGDDAWQRVLVRAGFAHEPFISMEAYPDEMTYALVAAICLETDRTADQVMHAFGRAWLRITSREFAELMRSAGRTFPEFLRNLDQLHTRVQLAFPKLRPPSFHVTDETDSSLRLHYESERTGLAPMVIGLVEGLGERFGVDGEATTELGGAEESHAVFFVRWKPRGSNA